MIKNLPANAEDIRDLVRVTGRQDRGPQAEESNHKCQTVFPPSLYKFKRFLLKLCVAMMTPGST